MVVVLLAKGNDGRWGVEVEGELGVCENVVYSSS